VVMFGGFGFFFLCRHRSQTLGFFPQLLTLSLAFLASLCSLMPALSAVFSRKLTNISNYSLPSVLPFPLGSNLLIFILCLTFIFFAHGTSGSALVAYFGITYFNYPVPVVSVTLGRSITIPLFCGGWGSLVIGHSVRS